MTFGKNFSLRRNGRKGLGKRAVIVSATPRTGGNSEILAESFAEGAREKGNEVELIRIRELDLQFCRGCLFCQSHDDCLVHDGMGALYERLSNADVLVFATPIYYYSVSGQLKTFLDRLNPLYSRQNAFRDVYLLASSADGEESAMDGAVKEIQGWVNCFDGVRLAGVLRGTGATKAGEIKMTDAPERAYRMGRSI